ncbi:30S ribosomal protein S1 [Geobacter pickeringii]|uniref:30S ribosomal protein S1 n=1 Tax=Geobacter pickeringii TaxID=345632 RepID=A0A0B5BFK8_9BACT|nr:30S ribosomal protein S1 [Geobacter pickeringii]AJE03919.1 30S ribosomal protein S1 [Geobacter pickeringii]
MTIDDKDFNETTEEESFAELFEKSSRETTRLKPGSKVEATVLKIGADWVFLDIGKKGEGVLDRKELLDNEGNLTAAEGDTITAWFTGSVRNELRFTTKLAAGAAAQSQLEDAWRAGIPVEGYVAKEIKGGFEVKVGGNLRAFCPFSQISLRRAENPAEFVGKQLLFKIAEYGERGRNIIVSHRQVLEEEQKVKREALKETLLEGMTVSGTVTRLADFGAFVDLDGIDGLIPVSEAAWTRVKHVRDVLSVGDQVSVVIKRIDWESGKISLSLKDTQADPWEAVAEQFPEGSYHTGTVARLAAFGAFVSLAPGIDGLIHISKLGKGKRISHPREALNEGETVEVKVDGVDRENRKLSLSLAEVSRAAEEEQKSVASFRQQTTTSSKESMGSFGDLLKAKLDEKQ